MAPQHIQFAETIRAMKLAMKRRADDSDSDHSIYAATNRGNKLQRRAQYVQSGRLDTTGGTQSYRKKINHAGYTRHIISTNPPLVDADGDILSPTKLSREASPIEDNAFGDVQLELLLRPLTSAAELPQRPEYRAAFTSPALTQMVDQVAEMARKERATLWKAKRLLQRFRADAEWMPCEYFETEHDEMLLVPGGANVEASEEVGALRSVVGSVGVEQSAPPEFRGIGNGNPLPIPYETRIEAMAGVQAADMAIQPFESKEQKNHSDDETNAKGTEQAEMKGGEPSKPTEDAAVTSIEQPPDPDNASEHTSNSDKNPSDGTNPPVHAMTTRARARSPIPSPSPSPTPSDSASIPPINPWFMIPPSALPDRDLGLPAAEAEESRRGLLLYVQKQEQIVRSLDTLYNGLQRSDRMRNDLFAACKTEGHMKDDGRGNMVTEMSDGEDWYDPFDWGLEARDLRVGKDGRLGLEKGKDEIDEVNDEDKGGRGGRRKRVPRM